MSRRIRNDEIELGSDSFLDIIANIVGILIILIVIAGVKVSRQPVLPQTETQSPEATTLMVVTPEESEPETETVSLAAPQLPILDEPAEEPEEPVVVLPLPVSPAVMTTKTQDPQQPRAQYDNAFEQKESNIRQYAQRSKVLRGQIQALLTKHQKTTETIKQNKRSVARAQSENESGRTSLERQRQELTRLRRLLAMPKLPAVDVEQIEHKVTPVGRDIRGKEVHFRISRSQLSYVPVDELVAELKIDAGKHQNDLMHNTSYQGIVGPIRGYRMAYRLERKKRSLSDDLVFGASMFRVVVDEWEVSPTADLEQETLSQAVQPGSLFDRRLATLPRDANVTFWVYPDSFDTFRQLQRRVHQEGLTVAGRPLPFGVAIAGSPNGTKSSGQ